MLKSTVLALTIAATTLTPTQAVYAAPAPSEAAEQIVEAKRETCWRTNRSTKQRFRIC